MPTKFIVHTYFQMAWVVAGAVNESRKSLIDIWFIDKLSRICLNVMSYETSNSLMFFNFCSNCSFFLLFCISSATTISEKIGTKFVSSNSRRYSKTWYFIFFILVSYSNWSLIGSQKIIAKKKNALWNSVSNQKQKWEHKTWLTGATKFLSLQEVHKIFSKVFLAFGNKY